MDAKKRALFFSGVKMGMPGLEKTYFAISRN